MAAGRGPIDLTECSSFLAHRNYDVYQVLCMACTVFVKHVYDVHGVYSFYEACV